MRSARFGLLTASGLLLASASALAQVSSQFPGSTPDRDWTATAARTVGAGANVIQAEGGWPGISVGLLHGYDDRTDIGARVAFNYSFYGTTNTATGVDLTIPIRRRLTLSDTHGFDIGVHAAPGIALYGNNGTLFGVELPVGIVAGYRIDPRTTFTLGADMPVLLSFTNPFGLLFGPLIGVGGEYKLQDNLAATLQFRVGPEFYIEHNPSTHFAFQTLIGVAYALR